MTKLQRVECSVCIESTTPSKLAVCPFCEFSCCKTCFTRVLLDGSDDAHCMSCRRRFDREVLLKITSSHFVNSCYKEHRERVLFEREISMIPATMPYVELEREKRIAKARVDELTTERNRLRRRLHQVNAEILEQQQNTWRTVPHVDAEASEARRAFTQRCTREDCLGWLNAAYRCGVCAHFCCSKCLVACGTERASLDAHACCADDVETVRAIRSDSTPCPSCGVRVSKVSGCSQMWCVRCHCAFDYRTGARINGTIHNPHWILYQQQNAQAARDPGDIPCGAMPTIGELRRVHAATQILTQAARIVLHIEHVEMPRLNPRADVANRQWRVRYILREIDEATLRAKVQRQDKADAKNHESAQVLEMVCHTITDELRQVAVREKEVAAGETAVLRLIEYANGALNHIACRYNQVTPRIAIERHPWRVHPRAGETQRSVC